MASYSWLQRNNHYKPHARNNQCGGRFQFFNLLAAWYEPLIDSDTPPPRCRYNNICRELVQWLLKLQVAGCGTWCTGCNVCGWLKAVTHSFVLQFTGYPRGMERQVTTLWPQETPSWKVLQLVVEVSPLQLSALPAELLRKCLHPASLMDTSIFYQRGWRWSRASLYGINNIAPVRGSTIASL